MEKHFLEQIFTTKDFQPQDIPLLISKFTRVTYEKHDFLLKEGQRANYYWFLESGFARSFVHDTHGSDITTSFYGAGEIMIEWSSFFMRKPTRENIQALSDCVCWQLDFDTFQELFHSIEAFREEGRSRLVNSYFSLKNERVSFIADEARERYLSLIKEKPQLLQNVSLKHIATYLGITKYSLSRIRKEIVKVA